jgi:hypothetical protein
MFGKLFHAKIGWQVRRSPLNDGTGVFLVLFRQLQRW